MVLLGFTVFKEKILDGTKTRTTRLLIQKNGRPRRLPELGEVAHLYWKLRTKNCELLKRTKVTKVQVRRWGDLMKDEKHARADGFDSLEDFREWFIKRYDPDKGTEFMIIGWG